MNEHGGRPIDFERILPVSAGVDRRPTDMPRSFAVPLWAALLAGCSSSVPRSHQPDRIDAFCADRVPIATAVESIVASTSGVSEQVPVPSADRIIAIVKESGGVIAHWNDQPLYLPKIAKSLGADGDYVTLGDAAIGNNAVGADSRRIYLTVRTKTGQRTLALRAFDVQDVCNEGKLKS